MLELSRPKPHGVRPAVHPVAEAMTALVVVIMLLAGTSGCTVGHRHSAQKPSAPATAQPGAAVSTAAATAVCGVNNLDSISAAAQPVALAKSFSTVVSGLPNTAAASYFGGLNIAGDRLYASFPLAGRVSIKTFNTRPSSVGSSAASAASSHSYDVNTVGSDPGRNQQFGVGGDGTVYVANFGSGQAVSALAPDGSIRWTVDVSRFGQILAVFGWHDSASAFAVGVAFGHQVVLLSTAGNVLGAAVPISGSVVSPQPDGRLITGDVSDAGRYVNVYSSGGVRTARFGSANSADVAGPGRFVGEGAIPGLASVSGAAALPDGALLIAEPGTGIRSVTADGFWTGLVPDGYQDSFTLLGTTPLLVSGGRVYFVASTDSGSSAAILSMTAASVAQQLHQPAFYTESAAPDVAALGYGAGLVSDATDNYFPAGVSPHVSAVFDSWWAAVSPALGLDYTISGAPVAGLDEQLAARSAPVPVSGSVQLMLPAPTPGAYQVSVTLVDKVTGNVRGSSCLIYTVGAPGQHLDFGQLPGQPDWGGAPPDRAVALAAQLGASQYRYSLSFDNIVPSATASADAAKLHLSDDSGADIPTQLEAAARRAAATGISFVLQVSQGDDTARAAVKAGTWGGWVTQIVRAFADRAPDITVWSAWNEPNNTGFDDGGDYARQVMKPFYQAVHSIEPTAVVVGGEALNVSAHWWAQVADGGGCRYFDAVGIHPYTGFNQSWEESGLTGASGQLAALKAVLAGCGAAGKPIWDTESGWTSDGPGNMWAQADSVARAAVWMKVYGISRWNYFLTEGGYGDNDLSLSLIQYRSHVKPAGLAFATANTLLAQRSSPATLDSAIPGAHVYSFAPTASHPTSLLAAWTDDLPVTASLVQHGSSPVTVTVTDEYGAMTTRVLKPSVATALSLSGSVSYVSAPAGVQVSITADQAFSADLLAGATASASSAADGASADGAVNRGIDNSTPWQPGAAAGSGPDLAPNLTLTLATPAILNRVLVAGASIHCCTAGLRDYALQVQTPAGNWQTVGQARNQFYQRCALFTFPAQSVKAVRISIPKTVESGVPVVDANYSDLVAGRHPAWWALTSESNKAVAIRWVAGYGPAD